MSETFRKEEDLLGFRIISDDHYYGIHTVRAVENFRISGTKMMHHPSFIKGLVAVKKAAVMTNFELNLVSEDVMKSVVFACEEILDKDKYLDQFPIDVFQGGAGTSTNMNVNEVIANIALEYLGEKKGEYDLINPNDHVNKSQSTNDAYPTGFRIALYQEVLETLLSLNALRESFETKAAEFDGIIKMGRTQLQDAVPMTLGQEFRAFATALKEEDKTVKFAASLLLEVNLGATAIGTRVNSHSSYQMIAVKNLAEITGLALTPSEDLIEATSDCGAYVLLQSTLKRLAIKLSKICNDLRLLSSGPRAGLNEINLPQKQAGSSIMPGKVNPVIPEVVNQVCFKVMGNELCVSLAAEAGQLQLNVMEPVIGQAMFESLSIIRNAMDNLRIDCIDDITANPEICKSYVINSIGIVTLLNPYIGHHYGDEISKICRQTGQSVKEVALELKLMSAKDLDAVFAHENLLR